MTHFVSIAVVRPDQDLDALLAPFDEGTDVDPYVDPDTGPWRQVLADLEQWDAEHGKTRPEGMGTAEYLDTWSGGGWRENPAGLTPEVIAAGTELVRYSTWNADSIWDWWVIGGRWSGAYYPEDRTDVATFLGDLARDAAMVPPGRCVFSDGSVLRRGTQGWFGMTDDHLSDEAWREAVKDLLLTHDATDAVVFLDLHV